MKIEEKLSTPRLIPEQELTIEGVHEYNRDIENMSTEDLVGQVEKLNDQILSLKKEEQALFNTDLLKHLYNHGKESLDAFKKSKKELKDSLDHNKEFAEELGVETISDAVDSERLADTDEIKAFMEDKKSLKDLVKKISLIKKRIKSKTERLTTDENISFRAEERDSSMKKLYELSGKFSGSIKALSLEHDRLVKELSDRIESYRQSLLGDKELSSEDEIVKRNREVYVDIAAKFGIEATLQFNKRAKPEKIKEFLKETIFTYDIGQEINSQELAKEKINEYQELLNKLDEQHIETVRRIFEIFGKSLRETPINIEVITANGYQGLSPEEGELKIYAFDYEGIDAYEEVVLEAEKKRAELKKLQEKYNIDSSKLDSEKAEKKPSFFYFSLKKKYKEAERGLEEINQQISVIKKEIDLLEEKVRSLQSVIVTKKEPLHMNEEVEAYLHKIDIVNYLYVHKNYGRGYEGARSKNPMQNVEDLFIILEKIIRDEITELQKKKKDEYVNKCIKLQEEFRKLFPSN